MDMNFHNAMGAEPRARVTRLKPSKTAFHEAHTETCAMDTACRWETLSAGNAVENRGFR